MLLSLKVRRGSSKEFSHTLRFLHSLTKTKLMETKVAEINAPLNKWSAN